MSTESTPSSSVTNAQNVVKALAFVSKLAPIPYLSTGLDVLAESIPAISGLIAGWKEQGHVTLQDVLDAEHNEIMAADARRDTTAAVAALS